MGKLGDKNALLTEELEAELSTINEKNMLPPRIVEKIGEKLIENNIQITKEQLYKLVNKIQSAMKIDTDIKKDDLVAVLTLKNEGVALVKILMSTEQIIQKDTGICAILQRVLMNKGTYPSIWKKT